MERLKNLLKGKFFGVDRINELTDDLLIHIVSFLTVKDAAKTSILSKRWIFLWTYQSNLNFDLPSLLGSCIPVAGRYLEEDDDILELDRCRFIRRMDQILQLYRGTKIDSFGVTFPFNRRSAEPVNQWISFVVKKGVEKLCLRFSPTIYYKSTDYQFHYNECYIFPGWLISQENNPPILKHLHLASCILCPHPNFSGFNSLITLHLEDVVLRQSDVANILSNSLKLESWTLVRCVLPNYFRVIGSLSHKLKHLTIHAIQDVKIEVWNMSSLETFIAIDFAISNLIFRNVPHLVKVYVEAMHRECRIPHVYQLAEHLPSVETVTINMVSKKALYLPSVINKFKKIDQSQRKKMPEKFDLLFVTSIVDAFPFLQKLHLMLHPEPDYIDQRNSKNHNKHLTVVEISGFTANWKQFEFVKHVVSYAVALDQLIIRQARRTYFSCFEWIDYKASDVQWTVSDRDKLFQMLRKDIRPDVEILIV